MIWSDYWNALTSRQRAGLLAGHGFGYLEYSEKNDGERNSGDRSNLLSKKIDSAQCNQGQRDQRQAERYFRFSDVEVERHAIFAFSWLFIAENQYRQPRPSRAPQ